MWHLCFFLEVQICAGEIGYSTLFLCDHGLWMAWSLLAYQRHDKVMKQDIWECLEGWFLFIPVALADFKPVRPLWSSRGAPRLRSTCFLSECNGTYNEVIMEMNRSEIFQRTALVIYSFFSMSDVIRAVKNRFFVLERSQVIQTANGKLEIFKCKDVCSSCKGYSDFFFFFSWSKGCSVMFWSRIRLALMWDQLTNSWGL